jgi:hypothetical protein
MQSTYEALKGAGVRKLDYIGDRIREEKEIEIVGS